MEPEKKGNAMSLSAPRRLYRCILAAVAALLVVSLVSVMRQTTVTNGQPVVAAAQTQARNQAKTAAAEPPAQQLAAQFTAARVLYVKTGYGMKVNGHWFGSYINDGHMYYCVSPLLGLDRGQAASTVNIWSLVGTTKSYELEYVLSRWGNTTSKYGAAATYDALNRIVGTSMGTKAWASFRAWERNAPPAVRKAAVARVDSAVLYHGPYRTTIKVTQQALVGQTGTAAITVVSATGHGFNATVALRATNATIAKSVRTHAGKATVHFNVTGTGTVKLASQAASLPAVSMLLSHPGSGQQLLLSWGPRANSNRAVTSYHKVTSRPSASYACTTDCAGNPVNTITKCKEAGSTIAQMLVYVNGKLRTYANYPASKSTVCKTISTRIADTSHVVVYFRYNVSHKWTAMAALLSYTVDCPPLPGITVTISCNCPSASLVFTLPVNGTKHLEEIVVNGKQVATAKPGTSATYRVTVTRGHNSSFSYASGVQNANGSWHVGQPLTTIVP